MEYTGQNLNENSSLQWTGDYSSGRSGFSVDNCYIPFPYYYPLYEQHYHNYYPTVSYITEISKIEQGFKIVGKMLENKIITKSLTIKEFIKLVNDIAEIL